MKEKKHQNGNCLCGSVKIRAILATKNVGVCHCQMCQKWGSLFTVQAEDVTFVGEENISIYDSSDWAERGFCRSCGSHLFYRLKQNNPNPFINFSPGLFEDLSFEFEHQIFIDRKPAFYTFLNATNDMTEAQVLKKFQ